MIKRAEAAGSPVLAWTIDSQGGGKRIVHARARRRDRAFCGTCHTLNPDDRGLALPGFLGSTINPDGKPMTTTPPLGPPRLDGRIATWDYVKRLKDATSMKVVLKGIVTREDAELALEYGADGIWVSNHGGRMENSLRSSVECVPEVAAGVAGRAPILVDGGFRRGTDIFKALALGATAVGVGRPYIFGLAAFGQPGVETALDILDSELRMVMRQAGTQPRAHHEGLRARSPDAGLVGPAGSLMGTPLRSTRRPHAPYGNRASSRRRVSICQSVQSRNPWLLRRFAPAVPGSANSAHRRRGRSWCRSKVPAGKRPAPSMVGSACSRISTSCRFASNRGTRERSRSSASSPVRRPDPAAGVGARVERLAPLGIAADRHQQARVRAFGFTGGVKRRRTVQPRRAPYPGV